MGHDFGAMYGAVLSGIESRATATSKSREMQFFAAAPLPRTMTVSDVDQSLKTPDAIADRLAWLSHQLQL